MKRRAETAKGAEKANKAKLESPFVRYCVVAVSCLLLVGVALCFMIFKTDTIINVSFEKANQATDTNRITVSTIMAQVSENENQAPADINIPGLPSLELTDNEVYEKLAANAEFADKAYALSCVYKAVGDVYGPAAAIGIMANVQHEGNFGLVQYDHSVPNWDGSNASPVSKASAPVIVSSRANAQAVYDMAVSRGSNNHTGVGIVQWTWHTYVVELGQRYLNNCTNYDITDIAKVEIDYLMYQLETQFSSLLTGSHTDVAGNWLLNYEKPASMYDELPRRRETAQRIYDLLSN